MRDLGLDDAGLWEAFHARTLSHADWTHHAHLRMAFLYLQRHALDEAHVLMRVGIVRLNATHGLVETVTRGYHETMTRTWLVLVQAIPSSAGEDSRAFCARHAERLGRDAPLRHYARERLFSVEARARFLEPDLAPFPRLDVSG